MSFESDFLDFCLSCDRHTIDGPYCSHACRLADLEKSGSSSLYSASPSNSFYGTQSTSSSYNSTSSGFHLTPALDFSSLAKPDRRSSGGRPRETVSRSSSVSSNSSIHSSTAQHTCSASCMSESARQELKHYESLFDQTRHRSYSSR